MGERIILCSGCGQKNRISDGKRGKPCCGTCGKQLAVSGSSGGGEVRLALFLFVALAALLFWLAPWDAESPRLSRVAAQDASAKPSFDAKPVKATARVMKKPT